MNLLDMRTVLFSYVISNFICLVFMVVLWLQSRRWFSGTGFWLARYVLQWLGVLLIALRGQLPDFFSSAIGNTLVAAGSVTLLIGMQRFLKKPGPQIFNFVFLGFFFITYSYFTVIDPNLGNRSFLLASSILVYNTQIAWLTLRQEDQKLAPLIRGVGAIAVLYCINSVAMVWYSLCVSTNNDLMQMTGSGALMILVTQMLSLMLSFNLFSMVSRLLRDGLREDIARREQAEETLRQSIDQIQQLNARLEHLAMDDALTGLHNRRFFFERGEMEIERIRRYQAELSLLMLDVDHFKQVNDTYGHDCGDLALQNVAHILRTMVRNVDIPARLGGEEFAVLLPNMPAAEALRLGERIREGVEQLDIDLAGNSGEDHRLRVTVSIGVASCRSDLSLDGMLRLADQSMYEAKHLGRNRVAFLEEP